MKLHSISFDWKCNYLQPNHSAVRYFESESMEIMAKHRFIFQGGSVFFSFLRSFSCRWLTLRHFWISAAPGMGERVSWSAVNSIDPMRSRMIHTVEAFWLRLKNNKCYESRETLTRLTGFRSAISESVKKIKAQKFTNLVSPCLLHVIANTIL